MIQKMSAPRHEPFRLIRLLDSTSRQQRRGSAWALFRFLLGPCHGYLQGAALVGTIARRLGIVAMSMEELAIGLLVGTLLDQRLDVVDLADLVHGLKQSSTPSTPPALPFEQECLAGG